MRSIVVICFILLSCTITGNETPQVRVSKKKAILKISNKKPILKINNNLTYKQWYTSISNTISFHLLNDELDRVDSRIIRPEILSLVKSSKKDFLELEEIIENNYKLKGTKYYVLRFTSGEVACEVGSKYLYFFWRDNLVHNARYSDYPLFKIGKVKNNPFGLGIEKGTLDLVFNRKNIKLYHGLNFDDIVIITIVKKGRVLSMIGSPNCFLDNFLRFNSPDY